MKKRRNGLLLHIRCRLAVAIKSDYGDMLFDALAISGFELDSFERTYWEPYSKEIDEIIENIRRACLEYENDPLELIEATIKLTDAAHDIRQKIGELINLYNKNPKATAPQPTPVARLFHERFSTSLPQAAGAAEQEILAERSIQRQQTLTHILVMQSQIDHGLTDIQNELARLISGGE